MAMKRITRQPGSRTEANRKSIAEKRVFSRVECLMDLELENVTTEPQEVEAIEAIDLSLLGLGFQRSSQGQPLPLGSPVTVAIHGFAPVHAHVRWNDGPRVGVQFCGRLHDIIESWVGEVLAAQGVRVKDLFEVSRN